MADDNPSRRGHGTRRWLERRHATRRVRRLRIPRSDKDSKPELSASAHRSDQPDARTIVSFEVILPFLRPIAHLIEDPTDHRNHGERIRPHFRGA